MGRRLKREEVMTIQVLHERGLSNRAIAHQLGIDEKAVRYRLARRAEGRRDGRSNKVFRAASVAKPIGWWMERAQARSHGANLQALYEWLVTEHGFDKLEGLQLLSQVGKCRVGNVVDPCYTVVAKFPKKYLP